MVTKSVATNFSIASLLNVENSPNFEFKSVPSQKQNFECELESPEKIKNQNLHHHRDDEVELQPPICSQPAVSHQPPTIKFTVPFSSSAVDMQMSSTINRTLPPAALIFPPQQSSNTANVAHQIMAPWMAYNGLPAAAAAAALDAGLFFGHAGQSHFWSNGPDHLHHGNGHQHGQTFATGPNSKSYRRRKARTVFSNHQLQSLEKRFECERYLSTPERIELAQLLNLSETQVSSLIDIFPASYFESSITEGSPVAVLPLQTGSPLNERLHAFGSEIIRSLNNTRLNSIVVLRIIYLPNDDTFKFSKISCRIPNPLCCEAFEINCGVSPETIHITTQVLDVDIASCEIIDPKENFALVSYPCQLGTLAYIPNLEKFDLKSSYKLIQHISLGQRMENPSHINDVCLITQLGNGSFEDLRYDVQKICNEFKPVVI